MAKIYKKSKLTYKNGYIVKDDKVIGVPNRIVAGLNGLERQLQEAKFNHDNPVESVKPRPEFGFQTERGDVFCRVVAVTPNLVEAVEKTMKIMDELDDVSWAERANKAFAVYQDIIDWVCDKHVVACKQQSQLRFDLKFIGNPLELTKDDIVEIIMAIEQR